MPFDWSDFGRLAERLSEDGEYSMEARRRTAASRFYYAAYWAVRTVVERTSPRPSPTREEYRGSHERVILLCKDNPDARMRVIGEHLDRLHENRVSADYRSRVSFGANEVYVAKRLYGNISGALAALRAGPQ
jgi:hypothetical protein